MLRRAAAIAVVARRIDVVTAFFLLTDARIRKGIGDIVARFFFVTGDNGHLILVGVDLASRTFAGGAPHGNGGFLRFVTVDLIDRIHVDVSRWNAAFFTRQTTDTYAATAVQAVLLNGILQVFGVDIARNVDVTGAIIRDDIGPRHVEVAAGFHLHVPRGVNAGLLRGGCRVISL